MSLFIFLAAYLNVQMTQKQWMWIEFYYIFSLSRDTILHWNVKMTMSLPTCDEIDVVQSLTHINIYIYIYAYVRLEQVIELLL